MDGESATRETQNVWTAIWKLFAVRKTKHFSFELANKKRGAALSRPLLTGRGTAVISGTSHLLLRQCNQIVGEAYRPGGGVAGNSLRLAAWAIPPSSERNWVRTLYLSLAFARQAPELAPPIVSPKAKQFLARYIGLGTPIRKSTGICFRIVYALHVGA